MTPALCTVAVRELCEFTAKHGDLDLRFTPSPTAQEGRAGHAVAAARRGAGYRSEVPLSGQHQNLRVRGRCDGFDPASRRLDEVKTFKGSLERQPAVQRHLHWAQAKVYGWLLCQQEGWSALDVALVYLDIGSQQETVLVEHCSAQQLQEHFEQHCERFLVWAGQQLAHRTARDAALQALTFPFGDFRAGQRPLAEAVYRAAQGGRCLLAQAPTGIGKTMGTLFPLLKAAAPQKLDKVFFLTAKTSGRQVALQALERLGAAMAPVPASLPVSGLASNDSPAGAAADSARTSPATAAAAALPLRVLELVARDKACVHPDKACHGQSCPLALGFYDRLPSARQAALPAPGSKAGARPAFALLDAARVQAVALAHQVCPYYLTQELARWADVVVGDYNHYFDSSALLHHLAQANGWRVALLVDEAHNLVERGRRMYTAELQPERLALARRSPGARASAPVKRALAKVDRCWRALDAEQTSAYAVHSDGFPPLLLAALQQCSTALGAHFAEHPERPDAALQGFYFDTLHLLRLAEVLDAHSLVDTRLPAGSLGHTGHITPTAAADPAGAQASTKTTTKGRRPAPRSVVCIRNLVPAPFLQPRLQAAHTSTLFSATLQPTHYYADLLGLPERFAAVDVASPFAARQLQVQVARHISTRFGHRQASLAPSVQLMAQQFARQPGNYLAFFSSYAYLQQVAALLAATHPQLPCWSQSPRMSEAEQRQFLERFTDTSAGIGFAVLGGSFAEGIDLPGRRLVGAFVSTLGLPQVNPVNEQVRARMQALFGAGYDYTYLYPGLQKVVQAAGRVIRTPSDQGVVYLLDDRFARPEVQRLLPRWWTPGP